MSFKVVSQILDNHALTINIDVQDDTSYVPTSDVDTKKIITVNLETEAPTSDVFTLDVFVIGEGYSDKYELVSVETNSPQILHVYKRNTDGPSEFVAFSDNKSIWKGAKYLSSRDSFFDVIISVRSALTTPSPIQVKGSIKSTVSPISKTIKVHGTVNGS